MSYNYFDYERPGKNYKHYQVQKSSHLSIVNWVNMMIEQEQHNSLGITLIYIMAGSGVASITAAFSVNETVSIPILMIAACLAMGTNAAVLSQQSFKVSSWFFIVSITINTVLLFYQLIKLCL